MKIKVIILKTGGTNCDYETKFAFEKVKAYVEIVHINQLINKSKKLSFYHILVLPGGFTYGDDIAAGKILANELKHRFLEELKEFINQGKLILGICNGFQVLVKIGMLPNFTNNFKQEVNLTFNDSRKFEARWVYLKTIDSHCVFTQQMKKIIYLPIAHAEGKFVFNNKTILKNLKKNKQIVFKYVNEKGEEVSYPYNPNGSFNNIAGICDKTGRILGLMPHPERYINFTQHPRWTREKLKEEGDGFAIFRNAKEFVEKNV